MQYLETIILFIYSALKLLSVKTTAAKNTYYFNSNNICYSADTLLQNIALGKNVLNLSESMSFFFFLFNPSYIYMVGKKKNRIRVTQGKNTFFFFFYLESYFTFFEEMVLLESWVKSKPLHHSEKSNK